MDYLISQDFFNYLVDIRRRLHMYPELDSELPITCDLIELVLKKYNIAYRRIDNFGIIAELGNSPNIICLRADIDALPINDLKSTSYASKIPNRAHACGHDIHTTIVLGIAIKLKSFEPDLKSSFRFIFQGAEETDGGALRMIESGVIHNAKYILGLHTDITLNTHTIGIKKGTVNASSNPFDIQIYGKGTHGAHPDTGIDSIIIATKIIDNLQMLISREIPATSNAVITIGKISGGETYNALAPSINMQGILRTTDNNIKNFLIERIKRVVSETASLYRGTAEIILKEGYPSFDNNDLLVDSFNKLFIDDSYLNIKQIPHPSMGVDDFSYYAHRIPGLYIKLGCKNESKKIVMPAHSNYFDVDEECIKYGIYSFLKFIISSDTINKVKD